MEYNKPLTKEAILENHFGSDYWLIPKEHLPHIFNGMDEWAKIVAIEFRRFGEGDLRQIYFPHSKDTYHVVRPSTKIEDAEIITDKQLYTLFIQQKNKIE